jgi:dUTP pyrophosphatase
VLAPDPAARYGARMDSPLPRIEIRLRRLPHGEGLPLPRYATEHAAGMDVVAAETGTLSPGARMAIATGFALAIPVGYEVQVRPRSGLALKHGVTCLNTPGTIDADYRGEVKVILANLGDEPFHIARGERIAQLVPAIVQQATFVEVAELDDTARGHGGFGSTGR